MIIRIDPCESWIVKFHPDRISTVRKRAQEVAKSEDKWDIFINTLSLGPKGNKDGVIPIHPIRTDNGCIQMD
ncbi:hypothetical protein RirG_021020 [Rhizophagus irregularis DAOM 197198w]|uniref:Uncharacterized protein n=1 Tax=Rhizophagus irregularis (strain DAOM 197198w) TaxID=1432141 RepID=A0A015K7Q7_RHIIW|nr:hypothetical protein RirG_021020 [Rhizophagus irregularis DAOM 197198w]